MNSGGRGCCKSAGSKRKPRFALVPADRVHFDTVPFSDTTPRGTRPQARHDLLCTTSGGLPNCAKPSLPEDRQSFHPTLQDYSCKKCLFAGRRALGQLPVGSTVRGAESQSGISMFDSRVFLEIATVSDLSFQSSRVSFPSSFATCLSKKQSRFARGAYFAPRCLPRGGSFAKSRLARCGHARGPRLGRRMER